MKTIVGIILALLMGAVQAQEVLKGKTPIATATCPVDKQYVMGKDKPDRRPCILFVDMAAADEKGWVLIFDKSDEPAAILEISEKEQKVVWRKGQVSL